VNAAEVTSCGTTITEDTTLTQNLTSGGEDCITIGGNNITLDCAGFSISGAGSGNGIYMHTKTGVTIQNCTISNFTDGIYSLFGSYTADSNTFQNNIEGGIDARYGGGVTITNNTFNNNTSYGIYHSSLDISTISNNTITNNTDWGLYLSSSTNITATGNTITNNEYGFLTINGVFTASNNDISNNTINIRSTWTAASPTNPTITNNYWGTTSCNDIEGKLQGVDVTLTYEPFLDTENGNPMECPTDTVGSNTTDLTEEEPQAPVSAVPITGCSTIIEDSVLTQDINSSEGNCIIIDASNVILDCNNHTITGPGSNYGVYIAHQTGVTVQNCTISNFTDGIYSLASSFTSDTNTFQNNIEGGIDARYSGNFTIANNTFGNNGTYGIYHSGVDVSTITNNTITNNPWGVYLSNTTNVTASDNTITGGDYGFLTTNSTYTANNNDIYNNTFNIRHVWNAENPVDPKISLNYWGSIDCNEIQSKLSPESLAFDPYLGSDGTQLTCETEVECTDLDDDGYSVEGGACGVLDCNDDNSKINPSIEEICNNIDDDCDGEIDEEEVCGSIVEVKKMLLDGEWQYQEVETLAYPAPTAGWQTISVPSYLEGYTGEKVWYKKTFNVTEIAPLMNLNFSGVKYDAQIYLNDQFVGSNLGGYEPFKFEISDYLVLGKNTLYVGVTDWTATFNEQVDMSQAKNKFDAVNYPIDVVTSAVGNYYYYYGIWDSVYLESYPEAYIDNVFIQTSYRKNKITVSLDLTNDSRNTKFISVHNNILDVNGNVVKTLREQVFELKSSTTKKIILTERWDDPIYWSPDNPYLYTLQTQIVGTITGDTLNEINTKFGFREFWAKGINFYLNGIKTKVFGSSTPPPTKDLSREQITEILTNIKNGNNNTFRLHNQPWPQEWYEVADEIGLLTVMESAYFCNSSKNYDYEDPIFWENYRTHLQKNIDKLKNHPSIVFWSMENELLHCIGPSHSYIEQDLADLVPFVKDIDPTRLVYFEADLDPMGAADVIGLHYPNEFPANYDFPNTASWIDGPVNRPYMYIDGWEWQKDKPLYIGEFGWVYDLRNDPYAILFGDAAYNDPQYYRGNTFQSSYYRNLARAEIFEMQIQAYRERNVSAIAPWSIFDDASIPLRDELDLNLPDNLLYDTVKRTFEPIRFFIKNYDKTFFSKQKVRRDIVVHNDVAQDSNLTFVWRFNGSQDQRTDNLNPGQKKNFSFTIQMPEVSQKTLIDLEMKLYKDSEMIFSETKTYSVFPKEKVNISEYKIGLYDPLLANYTMLKNSNIKYEFVDSLEDVASDLDILIIGAYSLNQETSIDINALNLLVENGLNVLVLEQQYLPQGFGLELDDAPATMSFKRATDSTIFNGLSDEDLKFWRGDNYIINKNIINPMFGNLKVIVDSGNINGLVYSPILEIPKNQGKYIFSQLVVGQKYYVEPVARKLFQNLVSSSLENKNPFIDLGVMTDDSNLIGYLNQNQVSYSHISTDVDLSNYEVILISGSNNMWNTIVDNINALNFYVATGGKLVLHNLSENNYNNLSELIASDYIANDVQMYPVFINDVNDLNSGLSNYDLHWLKNYQVKQDTYNTVLVENFDLANYQTIEAEDFLTRTQHTKNQNGRILIYVNGYIEENINFETGETLPHTFGISAMGTQAGSIYPIMVVKLDGFEVNRFYIDSDDWSTYTFTTNVDPGEHTLRIEFINYANVDGTNRHLYLDKLMFGEKINEDNVVLLTRPGALAQINKEIGSIIIDNIKWDTETDNPERANNYISNLLTNLNIRMGDVPKPPVVITQCGTTITENAVLTSDLTSA